MSMAGFRLDVRCDWGCGGAVHYPMSHCPWCGRAQSWNEDDLFEGECPHCNRGVDDWMSACPWCGHDATGRDLIPRALTRVKRDPSEYVLKYRGAELSNETQSLADAGLAPNGALIVLHRRRRPVR